ncbi:hypothetical protein FSP39_007794 [Pinctada imbricata]|uniref:Reverse transcriptase domain-containing protein n=1 Tax=Pinctada imbricata TaxID=66713 RepID=A0AA88YBU7_PINIB|nr:hypothetical protein FSP39_007794 [Pinctada imbricata]
MWILKNSKELLEHLKSTHFSRVHSIKAFDFSTLYTTIPHSKLKERLAKIISNAFTSKNGNRKYKFIVVNYDKTYFVKEKSDSENKYTETDIIQMLNFLIDNIFVVFGGKVFQQIVGIPMGTNCAPLLADIFLYSYEAEFIQSLVSEGKRYLASDFNFTYRYIDDVLSINNPKFADYLSSIYPSELEVKETTETNNSASYLDIMLSYDTDGHMNTSLYDKRDDFNFSITNFPFLSSNIPSSPAYGVFISQLIRYARASTKYTDFVLRARRLSDKLLSQGYVCDRLTSSLRKFYGRYGELVIHYDVPLSRMVDDILQGYGHYPYLSLVTGRKVLIRYRSKSSRDFIPSFVLTSTPECINTWCDKPHKWPPQNVVFNIRRCKYYIVAKPAIKDENIQKDFCLGCNEAEMLLADAWLPIQRKSMLLIKAFVKSVLKKFADHITTFHWKTALYRVSESKDIFMDDSPGNIIKFTQEVIEYMTQSVCERKLQHFFCDSNLFAGLSDDTVAWFTNQLIYLHDNIERCLERFLVESEKKEMKVEEVDESRIQMATKTLLDDSNENEVQGILSFMSGIVDMTDDDDNEKLAEAIIDVFLHVLPYLKKETDSGKNSSWSNRENPGASSSTESGHNTVGDSVISLMIASSGPEEKKAQDKLVQNLLAGFLKK